MLSVLAQLAQSWLDQYGLDTLAPWSNAATYGLNPLRSISWRRYFGATDSLPGISRPLAPKCAIGDSAVLRESHPVWSMRRFKVMCLMSFADTNWPIPHLEPASQVVMATTILVSPPPLGRRPASTRDPFGQIT